MRLRSVEKRFYQVPRDRVIYLGSVQYNHLASEGVGFRRVALWRNHLVQYQGKNLHVVPVRIPFHCSSMYFFLISQRLENKSQWNVGFRPRRVP
jgi:hypothetical protein